ncbi:peptide ABC transporter ATP-binding protein [Oceanicola granulosus HTCC2516]|uniref:Peptide ABC transporter ATP-binding protein n=1 Tax=Oceanicola granulosus (strain ATCC BAA-861 / DSM 15982 / KCTC 12143 / HTCC2516) TaxID=314256 RepID=Q2CJF3_OCEGH|nr:ABC transporter ATP-binding protein [Oceanicola granulosus]EAR52647.1 peptide ABC transporter ATP-binding protein [Oceanicola granulosus HTCC2516]
MSAPAVSQAPADAPALDVRGVTVRITTDDGGFNVVEDISLAVAPGETLCIVGESGCGKSMTALSLLRLLPDGARVAEGAIRVGDTDLLALSERQAEDIRGDRIAMIFQEPLTALNPVMKVGAQIAETLARHRGLGRKAAWAAAVAALKGVQMPDAERRAQQYPHELSGGMRQRAMIALALACDPSVIVADEPTTALDVTVQAQILGLLRDLQRRHGTAVVVITHDLAVVAETADRVIVMYAGRRVEEATITDLFDSPLHPYTRGLMGAIPKGRAEGGDGRLTDIPGTVPALWNLPRGCAFAPRCPLAIDKCRAERPPLEDHRPGHRAACWRVDDAA